MTGTIKRFLQDRSAATAIEYGLIVALIALGIVGGVGNFSNALQYMWGDNNSRLNQAIN